MPLRTRISDERGLTLIEVMAAMVILLIGVLGTVTLVQMSVSSTSRTTAREQGTNLVRDLVERSRQASFDTITRNLAGQTLRTMLPAADNVNVLTPARFEVTRRQTVYTVTVTACSIDDPTDGVGVGDASFCPASTGNPGPGSPPPVGVGPAHSVLGVDVGAIFIAAGGSLLTTVCNVLGTDAALLTKLTSVVSKVVPISVCPSSSPLGSVQLDSHTDDLRRVRVEAIWDRGASGSVSQTTLLTNPLQN